MGQLFEVDIPEDDVLLDEDLPLSWQSDKVINNIKKLYSDLFNIKDFSNNSIEKELSDLSPKDEKYKLLLDFRYDDTVAKDFYKHLSKFLNSKKEASLLLNKYGIKGIKYDGYQDGECVVVFDDKAVEIIQKFYQEEYGDEQNYNDERKDYKFFLKDKEIVYDGRKVATLGELRKHKSFELVNDLFDPKDDNIEIKLLEKSEIDKMKAKGYKVLAYFNANTNAIYISEDFTIGSIVHEYTHLLDNRTNQNNIFFRIENFLYRRLRNQQPKNEQEKEKQFESYKSFISERYASENEQTANERLLNNDKRGQFRLPTKRTPTFMGKISELEWGRRRFRNNVGNGKGISKTSESETTTINGSIQKTTSRNDIRTNRGINDNNFYPLDNSDIKAHIPGDIDEILPKVKPPKDNLVDRVGGVISTRADIINPKIKHALRRFEFESGMNENKYTKDVKGFITKLDFMTPSDYAKYDLALKNGNKEVINTLNSKYNVGEDYTKVRSVLDNIRDEALNVGMNIGFIDEYFPRKIINASAILDEYSKSTYLKKMLHDVDPNNVLSPEDKIEKLNIALKGYNGAITASGSFIKARHKLPIKSIVFYK